MTRELIKKYWNHIEDFKNSKPIDMCVTGCTEKPLLEASQLFKFLAGADLDKHWEALKAFKNGQDVKMYSLFAEEWVPYDNMSFSSDREYKIQCDKYKGCIIDPQGRNKDVQEKLFEIDKDIGWNDGGREVEEMLGNHVLLVELDGTLFYLTHQQKNTILYNEWPVLKAKQEWPELFEGPTGENEDLIGRVVTNGKFTGQILSVDKSKFYLSGGGGFDFDVIGDEWKFTD